MPRLEFVGIKKSVQMVAFGDNNAWRVMINADREGQLFYPFLTMDSFLLTTKYRILLF